MRHCSPILLLGLLALACSDDTDPQKPDAGPDSSVLARYGSSCEKDADCATSLCVNKTCSITCKGQADCPSVGGKGFDCGEVSAGKLACYPRTYELGKKGGMGADCSFDGKCEGGALCTGQVGDADRYCAAKCQSDMACPPQYRCAAIQQGVASPAKDKYCLKRAFCHPCVLDEQCGGSGDRCVKDTTGAGYCAKACTPAPAAPDGGTADAGRGGTCPDYARCQKTSAGDYQCVHRSGKCSAGLDGKGSACDPCFHHYWKPTGDQYDPVATVAEAGQCKAGGVCVLIDRYTGESACLFKCDASDKCAESTYECFKFPTSLKGNYCMKWETVVYSGKQYKGKAPCHP